MEFLALDTETNGRMGDLCEMTEVGCVLVGGGELHEEWSSLVRVERPLSRGIQRFTGISQAMVDDAPPPEEVLPRDRREAAPARAGRAQRLVRQAGPEAGVRARRRRVARPARPLHGRDGPPLRPARAPAQARPPRRVARDRGRRDPPGAARRAHLRADLLRALPEAVRERGVAGRRAPAARAAAAAVAQRAAEDPARAAARPVEAPGRPRRLRVPQRGGAAAVRGQVRGREVTRPGALLPAGRVDRPGGGRRLHPDQLRAGRARAREPADQAVEADRATARSSAPTAGRTWSAGSTSPTPCSRSPPSRRRAAR